MQLTLDELKYLELALKWAVECAPKANELARIYYRIVDEINDREKRLIE